MNEQLDIDKFKKEIKESQNSHYPHITKNDKDMLDSLEIEQAQKGEYILLKVLVCKNQITHLSKAHKRIIFKYRNTIVNITKSLPLFLKSVDWTNPLQIAEAYTMLNKWKLMDPELALILLSDKYSDKVIRDYAVSLIADLDEEKFYFYTPQLTQALVHEEYHESSLCDLLLKRSLECPYSIGHAFFWYLKSNLHVVITYERYSLIIEQF